MNIQPYLDVNYWQHLWRMPLWRKRAAWACFGIAAALLLWSLMTTSAALWYFFTTDTNVSPETTTAPPITRPLPNLAQLNLFGTYVASLKEIPKTQSRFVLEGIFSKTDPRQSKVLMSTSDTAGKLYAQGDSLPDGAKVYKILPNGVILERNGKLEQLGLSRDRLEFAQPPQAMRFSSVQP